MLWREQEQKTDIKMTEVNTLSLKKSFIKIRDNYVINQVQKANLPEFTESEIRRYRVTFSGRVQKVGFRLEVCELAIRLGLTGFCQNLENGDVLAELQGPKEKIKYLVSFMESLKRIKIKNKVIKKIELVSNESEFVKKSR